MKRTKHIHFVGIKGVGMAALAILAKEARIRVTGSDFADKFVTDEILKQAGITWKIGFSPQNLKEQPDLVIVTGAHGGMTNPEAQVALKKGLKVVMQGEAVGMFMKGEILGRDFEGVSVCGSHGKTTTAAMLAVVLARNNLDPSFAIGCGEITNFGPAGHFGKGKYFVAEADEYATCPQTDKTPKFLWQNPKIILVTNIEYDHPDVFADIGEVKEAFLKFMQKVPPKGLLVAGRDSPNVRDLLKMVNSPVVTFGESPQSDWRLAKFSTCGGKTKFKVEYRNKNFDDFELLLPGKFNALNALGALVVGQELGISPLKIKKALAEFSGAKRRFEFIGEVNGAKLYDDYAHHPTEIALTLSSAKEFFPDKKIICIFQPHTYSRTKALLSGFARCFTAANEVLIVDIFSSSREKNDFGINSQILTEEIAKYHPNVKFLGQMEKVIAYLERKARRNEVIFTMGAGDIFLYHSEILTALKGRDSS